MTTSRSPALLVIVAAAFAGCSSDTGGLGPDDTGATSGANADGEPGGTDAGGADGLTAGADSDAGDETGGPGPGALECELHCGNGDCELDVQGQPACACPAGEAAVGLTCLPCVPSDGSIDADIPVVSFAVDLSIDGQIPSSSPLERGQLVLVDRVRGDEAIVGGSQEGAALETSVFPGDYEVVWRHQAGSVSVPRNTNARLGRVGIEPDGTLRLYAESPFSTTADGRLAVDITTTTVTGTFTIAGANAPSSTLENGTMRLVDPATGDEVALGETSDGSFSVRAIPGRYEVRYGAVLAGSVAPRNHDALVQTVEILPGDDEPMVLDVPVVVVSGAFQLDGNPAPTSVLERGRIALREVDTRDEIDLGFTNTVGYSVPVVPGTYELVYRYVQGSLQVPRNESAVLRQVVVDPGLGPTADVDIDIDTTTISGAFTVGELPPPTDSANVGEISLQAVDSDDHVPLGNTNTGAYEAIVIPGDYTIHYSQQAASGLVPTNTNAQLGAVDMLIGELPGDLDVPFAPVAGNVLLNGADPPSSEYDDGRIYLRNTDTQDSVLLGNTRLGAVDGLVVPGLYEVYYVVETPGAMVPQNTAAFLQNIEVSDGVPLDLPVDIISVDVQGTVSVAGAPPPQSDADRANLVLEDIATDDTIYLGDVTAGAFSAPLTAGTYVLYYEVVQTTGALPNNQRAPIACYVLGD
jgi:hypothetical protein